MRRFVFGMTMFSFALLAPGWATANDQEIAKQIVQKLKQRQDQGELKGFSLDLQVKEGVVWLKGHVSDNEQEYLALDIARRVPGVVKVVDAIDVNESATAEPRKSPIENSQLIEREPTPAKASEAAEYAAEPQVVKKVVVKPVAETREASSSDEQIAETIINKLRQQKDAGKLRGFGVDVSVVNGDVWLKGRVSSSEQRDLVLDTARYVRGVKQVINDLSITTPNAPIQNNGANDHSVVNAVANKVQAAPDVVTTNAAPAMVPSTMPVRSIPMKAIPVRAVPIRAIPVQAVPAAATAPMAVPAAAYSQVPRPFAPASLVNHSSAQIGGTPVPMHSGSPSGYGVAPARFDHPNMPGYAWPSYAAHPNYAAVTYPKQYSAQAWPYIGPFYPYPQVPLGWRKVELQWDDGWWFLDYKSK